MNPNPPMHPFWRALLTKVFFATTVGALWYGGSHIRWPSWVMIAAQILAAAVMAGSAHFLTYWTKNIADSDGVPPVKYVLRGAAWLAVLAAVSLWMVASPEIGLVALAFLFYVVGNAWPRPFRWLVRKVRFEDVALRADDPRNPRWKRIRKQTEHEQPAAPAGRPARKTYPSVATHGRTDA